MLENGAEQFAFPEARRKKDDDSALMDLCRLGSRLMEYGKFISSSRVKVRSVDFEEFRSALELMRIIEVDFCLNFEYILLHSFHIRSITST